MTQENQAVRFLLLQHLRVALLARLVVLRIADEDGVAVFLRRILNPLENQCEERIRDVGDRDE